MPSEDKVTVKLSKELYEKAKRYVESEGGFDSVDEFIEFVVEQVLEEETGEAAYTPEEEEKIKERLRSLGYL
ncbi:MAG TPA: CopG family transcriptional regulator [Candidatus Bathyarchaeota archaeon]|nr:CopG family transcriptional regulator [Candidatus Bathyarchaeota archaeon]